MRIRVFVGVLISACALLVFTTSAAAQGLRTDVSGGYQFFRFIEDGASNVPKGWGASFAIGKETIKGVGDVSGHYLGDFEGEQLHMFQGGVEVSGRSKRTVA